MENGCYTEFSDDMGCVDKLALSVSAGLHKT